MAGRTGRRFASTGDGAYLGGDKTSGLKFMSVVERLEDRRDPAMPSEDGSAGQSTTGEVASPLDVALNPAPAARTARLRPLLALAPYMARYRGRVTLAFISLTVAAITTLVVPLAVRRMIDFGFTPEGIARINSYFSVMIAVVAVLALEIGRAHV